MDQQTLIELTADIVAAHVENNQVSVGDVGNLIQQVHHALSSLGEEAAPSDEPKMPVVSVRASIKRDYIVCMECGKKQKTLKRHLMSAHNMTPAEYRKDYGLPDTYPMVAPAYSEQRRSMAHSLGLGRKGQAGAGSEDAPPRKSRQPKKK